MARDAYTQRQMRDDQYGMLGVHGDAPLATVPGVVPIMPGTPAEKRAYQKKVALIGAGAVAIAAVSYWMGRRSKHKK